MEESSTKKGRRKIRRSEELNQLDCNKSLAIVPSKGYESEKKTSKKKNSFFYLPKINLNLGSNEKYSLNLPEKKPTKIQMGKSDFGQNLQKDKNSETKARKSLENSPEFSTDEEKREPAEIEFIQKLKSKKQQTLDEQMLCNDILVLDFRNEETPEESNARCNPTTVIKIPNLLNKPEATRKEIIKLDLKSDTDQAGNISKQDQTKAVDNETKVQKSSLKDTLQNVRSNRGFELRMKMRNGKKLY